MGTKETARTIAGSIGNVTTFLLFASPMPTFYRIAKNKSVEEFKPDPYLAGMMNCIFWVFYGLPIIHPDYTLVVTVNGIGLALQFSFVTIFFIYTDNKQRMKILLWLCAEVVVTAAIATVALLKFQTHADRSKFVGIFCALFGVILYSSPLTIMRKVCMTKSVEFMPFWLSMAAFVNGVVWVAYALIKFDPFILTNDGCGAILGATQLLMYAYYYKSTPKRSYQILPTCERTPLLSSNRQIESEPLLNP